MPLLLARIDHFDQQVTRTSWGEEYLGACVRDASMANDMRKFPMGKLRVPTIEMPKLDIKLVDRLLILFPSLELACNNFRLLRIIAFQYTPPHLVDHLMELCPAVKQKPLVRDSLLYLASAVGKNIPLIQKLVSDARPHAIPTLDSVLEIHDPTSILLDLARGDYSIGLSYGRLGNLDLNQSASATLVQTKGGQIVSLFFDSANILEMNSARRTATRQSLRYLIQALLNLSAKSQAIARSHEPLKTAVNKSPDTIDILLSLDSSVSPDTCRLICKTAISVGCSFLVGRLLRQKVMLRKLLDC
ncbi:UNVERIFIED_CONTAM: hypothetical protein HDU68_003465 [Siphonaria sp. JEL0065]|nr:hypothetical protein HDU68_003465 [Siphonaria sp. JEL0065]